MIAGLPVRIAAAAIAAMLGMSGCSKKPVPPTEVLLSALSRTNNLLFAPGSKTPFTGLIIEKYAEGQIKSRSSISNGILEGISEGWHQNGKLQIQEKFRAGISDGIRTKWDTNGVKISEATIVAGKLHGSFKRWHSNGVLADEANMSSGKPDGLARAWHPSGAPKSEVVMKAGEVIESKQWEDNASRQTASLQGSTP
jgi:antitoxin component YwqK of YwqJK toxin-antitoxin module